MAATLLRTRALDADGKVQPLQSALRKDGRERGLQLGRLSAGDRTGGHMPLFFSLLSPSLLPRPSVKGHFNDEHVLNSFVYLAAALIRHLKADFFFLAWICACESENHSASGSLPQFCFLQCNKLFLIFFFRVSGSIYGNKLHSATQH